MYLNESSDHNMARAREHRGNAWSGVVALALLAMFTVALIASESATDAEESHDAVAIVIAGQ
ncbi:MAG: hypothetical protein AAGJ86_00080 [Pseudomonadota bacterium]